MRPSITVGDGPLLLAQPHGGTDIPDDIAARLNPLGLERADTDWHITRLYADLVTDATIVSTPVHRYVIDANRDPADASLYPGQNTTSLCPTTTFDGKSIYLENEEPSADEIAERREAYHRPYHDAIAEQLERIRARHGFAVLYDCHSIRSYIPFLFEDRLPDFNIGSNSGHSCAPELEQAVAATCAAARGYSHVINGRFKGGWTTRHYGAPANGIHAIQMELAQATYMQETAPWTYDMTKADTLRVILADVLRNLIAAAG